MTSIDVVSILKLWFLSLVAHPIFFPLPILISRAKRVSIAHLRYELILTLMLATLSNPFLFFFEVEGSSYVNEIKMTPASLEPRKIKQIGIVITYYV